MDEIKVSINNSIEFHKGYHYELLNNPPDNTKYIIEPDFRIPIVETIFAPDVFSNNSNCLNYKNYTVLKKKKWKKLDYDYFPYFREPKDLIHSVNRPIISKKPYIIDLDMLAYPWLYYKYEWEECKFLKRNWAQNSLSKSSKKRINILKNFMLNKYCKKLLPWSKWLERRMKQFLKDKEIVEKIEHLYPALTSVDVEKQKNDNIVLFCCAGGGYFYKKGGDNMFEAFDKIKDKYDIQLIYVGEVADNYYKRYSQYDNITIYRKRINKEKLFEIYQSSDIFVLPTRMETFGMVLLEAMNFKLPVITTVGNLVPVSDEIVENNVSGYLVEQKNQKYPNFAGQLDFETFLEKIKVLIENDNLRDKMGKAGKKEITHGKFNIKKRNKKLRKIYEEAIS